MVLTIIFRTFCSKLHQEIRCDKKLVSSFLDKKYILKISLSIFLLLFLVSLSLHTTYAQPSTNKNAIIFLAVHIYESHDTWGCGDWNLYAQARYPDDSTFWTVVLDYCVDQDNTYGLVPLVALVLEYQPDQKPFIWLYGEEEDWLFDDQLFYTVFEPFNPPFSPFLFSLDSATIYGFYYDYPPDYWTGLYMIDCHSSAGQYQPICNLPPGPYYKWPDQDFWIYGVPPDPDIGP